MQDRINKIQSEQEKRYVRGKILAFLDRCVELNPEIPIMQHLWTIARPHSDDPFSWDNDKLLGKFEDYYRQLSKIESEDYEE